MKLTGFLCISILIGGISSAFASNSSEVYELDVSGCSLRNLRELPIENFRKEHIKIYNITSRKFFDPESYTQSIYNKILKVINSMCHTPSQYIKKIEYSFLNNTEVDNFKVDHLMKKIATGLQVHFLGNENYILEDWRPGENNVRYYNIMVIRNNEPVKPIGQIDVATEIPFVPGLPL